MAGYIAQCRMPYKWRISFKVLSADILSGVDVFLDILPRNLCNNFSQKKGSVVHVPQGNHVHFLESMIDYAHAAYTI